MGLIRLVLFVFLCSSSAVLADINIEHCNENSTITSPKMSANIDIVLAQVAAKTAQNGYGITTYGKGSDTVYGLGQCRRDVNRTECSYCIHDAAKEIRVTPSGCGDNSVNSTDAWMWYERCLLRYKDENFFGKFDPSGFFSLPDVRKPKNPKFFKEQVGILMNNLTSQAVVPDNKGFAKGNVEISSSVTVYGLVLCTEDLSPQSCLSCLRMGIANFPKFCKKLKTVGCRVLYGSCLLRYEIIPF